MSAATNLKKATEQLQSIGEEVDQALLEMIVKGLGIANQSVDASIIAASDKGELETVKTQFLQRKLGIKDEATCDAAIKEVMGKLASVRQKQRGAVYYLLTQKFGRKDVYGVA